MSLKLSLDVKPIRIVDERLMSYNVEMTEVTGGTFWNLGVAPTEPVLHPRNGFCTHYKTKGLLQNDSRELY